MISLMFAKQKQYFIITIENKVVKYWDKLQGKIWGTSLQYLPPDPSVKLKIINSRNKIPANFISLMNIPTDELAEFNNAKNDEELKELVLRDCKRNACTLISEKRT